MTAPPDNAPEPRPRATEADLFALFDQLGIAHATHRHRPVFTVDDATTAASPADMLKFVRATGHDPIRLSFDGAGVPSLIEPRA